MELPGSLEKIEELLGGVDSWAAEMGRLLSKISHEGPVKPEMEEHLQVKMLVKILVPQILILRHGFVAGVK